MLKLKTIFETLFAAINLGFPKYFMNAEKLKIWMVNLTAILTAPCKQQFNEP